MKIYGLVYTCLFFLAIAAPLGAFADGPCTFPEYTQCGTALAPVTFTLTDVGLGFPVIIGDWFGAHADFIDSVYIYDITANYIGPMSYTNQDGQEPGSPILLTDLNANIAFGDQLEFVIHVASDPNHPDGIDYCWGLDSCYKDFDGSTKIGHVFAEALPAEDCDLPLPCVFMGFEDLPNGEGVDYDYNDFEFYVYGVTLNGPQTHQAPTPEPASIVLLAGMPLALALRKLRVLK
jgi:hypothetical protein